MSALPHSLCYVTDFSFSKCIGKYRISFIVYWFTTLFTPLSLSFLCATDEQFFLQFDFMNCYLLMMGMDAVLCEERTRQACSVVLNAPEHRLHDNIFEKFYNDLPTLCYHAAVRILSLHHTSLNRQLLCVYVYVLPYLGC